MRELGCVRIREPVGPAESPARGTYELAFAFWFRYLFPRRSRLERGCVDEVYPEIERDLAATTPPRGKVGALDEVGCWTSRDGQTEIDVVGLRRGRCELLGSCKWRRTADERVLDALIATRDRMGRAAGARLAVFAREGFTTALQRRSVDEDVLLVTLADLYAPSSRRSAA